MKLSELISQYGDSEVKVQYLDRDMIAMSDKGRYREFKFGSVATFHVDETVKIGIVVWMDREKMESIMQKHLLGEDDAN